MTKRRERELKDDKARKVKGWRERGGMTTDARSIKIIEGQRLNLLYLLSGLQQQIVQFLQNCARKRDCCGHLYKMLNCM